MKRYTKFAALKTALSLGALIALVPFAAVSQSSKEVDDLYFSKNDRVKIKYATNEEGQPVTESQATYESYSNNTYNPTYSAKTVNPEYIAKYKSASQESVQSQLDEQAALDNQENQNYSSEDYYVDGYNSNGYTTSGASTVNIYTGGYGNNWNSWMPYNNYYFSAWNSPYWNPYIGFSIGYNWGWGGMGYGFGYPGGFYDPWGYTWGGYY
ncbi:MAG: hypothetical protein RIB86_01470, partial [Imperialibacter sp.]